MNTVDNLARRIIEDMKSDGVEFSDENILDYVEMLYMDDREDVIEAMVNLIKKRWLKRGINGKKTKTKTTIPAHKD